MRMPTGERGKIGRDGRRQHDALVFLSPRGDNLALRFIDLAQDLAGPFVEDATRLRRRNAARVAFEQRDVEILFELPDQICRPSAGLRNEPLLRGPSDVARASATRAK